MTVSTRLLLAVSLSLAPFAWAAAQDQRHDDQQPRERKEQQQPQQPQSPPRNQTQQHAGPQQGTGGAQQFQRPAQNNPVRPSPPPGATASPAPPPGQNQFRRVQGPPPNGGGAPTGSAQQQQFQPRSVQRGGPPTGAPQQQTTISRGNLQPNTRSNTAIFAQRHGGAAPTQFGAGRFYGRDFAHFTPHEAELWRRGAWRHEFHDGRFGWWYAVDGIWYFYDEPVYPYPTFVPDVVYIPEEEDVPVYADAPPEPAPPEYDQPASYYYYFCPDTQTYYPYVTSCVSPWQPVPAAPQ